MRARRRKDLACILAWLSLSAAAGRGELPLRVPVVDFPPYAYVDENGTASGMHAALVRELARRMGRTAQFIPANLRTAQRGVRVGRFDVDVMPRTEERRADYWFSPVVLFNYRHVVLAGRTRPEALRTLADLEGYRVAVQAHDVAEILLSRYPGIERITVPDYPTGLRLVDDGHADFFVGNHDVSLHLINTGQAPALRPVLLNVAPTPACFAVGRNRPDLAQAVGQAVVEMSDDGTLDRLAATWLGGEFVLPPPPGWLVRNLKPVLVLAGAVLFLLLCFVVLLQALVKQRTRTLEQVRASLQKSEEQYRQVFNTANDAIFIIDFAGTLQACSERVWDMYGYRPDELVGQPVTTLLHPDGHRWEDEVTYLREQESHIYEAEHVKKDGQRIHVELSARVIAWENSEVIVSCARDISDRKRAERALRESQVELLRAQRVEMAAIVAGQIAHDFNNLLSPLLGLPKFIKAELPEGSRARQDVDVIRKSAERMGEISQQLLTLGRRGHYDLKPVDLNRVLEDTLQSLEARKPDGIEVRADLDASRPAILGGGSQLLRAFFNIMWNAVEAMDEKGVLEVRTESVALPAPLRAGRSVEPGDYAKVTIRDNGPGIPGPLQERIFEPFFTTRQDPKRRGTGLGLSVVLAVVEDHNGVIDVASEPGRGTAFFLYFPLCRRPVEEEAALETVGGTERLLVVDDDEMQISVFDRILSDLGYQVAGVRSGEEAVAYVEKNDVDLLLLDMVMEPGIDGAETYRRIKKFKPDQRALIVTGYAEKSVVMQAQELGVATVLRKPLTDEALARAVRLELDRGR